ncbi:MAG: hypothetical protein A3F84_02590 [Candidatus Handelsmanbacteria bacterium RIFCSPLOWO2_12_FULL_64_10]|uniref:FlgD/Vpr Ig-like domain-containing protein n=1 Tax=Handelsmanbacteria sp. (strain RIFCSPLOWO2_12_FULL_64_10) TaxID=1817868 RepID=A0A1F6CML4_HANXR|nr:MAG: hypothetical protein A3F84_02590 [Candidatus Handelsmanbacteria bacterium RIFCSPLOWO2_12_FULL_64_10]
MKNYPNPFNPSTTISYTLPEASTVRLTIYNILGQQVRTLINNRQAAGIHAVQWDGHDDAGRSVASGLYFYRLTAGEFTQTQKMLLLK